jgi:hypothetical protein
MIISAIEVCAKLPMPPVAGSMKQTSELPMQKQPRRTSCARTIAAKSVARLLTMLPAVVIGVDAPPMGRVPTLTGTPARTAAMIWSECAAW